MSNKYKVVGDDNGVRNIAGEIYKDGDVVVLNPAVGGVALEQGFVEPFVEEASEEAEVETKVEETEVKTEPSKKNELKFHYVITNKETGERLSVLAHTFGNDFVDFAREGLTPEQWSSPDVELFRFQNPHDDDTKLSSDVWEIEKHEWTEESVDGVLVSEPHID